MESSLNDVCLRTCRRPDGMETELFCITDPLTNSNCYILRQKERCAVIDPNCFLPLCRLMQKWNAESFPVLLTHEHCDHICGLNALRKHFHTTVISSLACSLGIQSRKENMSQMMEVYLYYKSGEKTITPYAPFRCQAADLPFEGEMSLPFGNSEFWMKALPGHTHGSSVITLEDCLFCGDYLLPGERVITRLPGGSREEYEGFARPWLREIPDGTWIYPGHGEEFQMNTEVRQFHEL